MKILLSSDVCEYQISGVSNSNIALKDELRKLGHDVRMLVLSPNDKSYFKDNNYYIASKPIPIYPGARFSLKIHDRLIQKIIDWKPDIVHAQSEFSSKILANRIVKALNIPLVITCHALYEDYTKYFCPSRTLGKKIVKIMSNKIYNSAKTLIVPSDKLRIVEEGYGIRCPIEVIPSGINLDVYKKQLSTKERVKILSELGLRNSNKYLVTVCRLAAEKNIDELLRYLPTLLKRDKDIKLIIVGDGPYKTKLVKEISKLDISDYVIFTGAVSGDEIYKYYQLGNIFVSASTSETQGLTYIEALASGMPMVCKKDKCLDGVIEKGANGFVFGNEKEFVESVLLILNDSVLMDKMRKSSLEKSGGFSKEEFGLRVERLYKKILSQ